MRAALAPHRLAAQRLVGESLESPEAVVAHLGAVQAQEHLMAPWAVARRCGATAADVAEALDAGRILRTHVLRPTWHYVLPADLPRLQAVTGPRVRRLVEGHSRTLGLQSDDLRRGADAVADVVRRRGPLTRAEVRDHLAAIGLAHRGDALAQIVVYAELDATIASGPMRGKQQTYLPREEPLPTTSQEELLAWLAAVYARGHGPFTDRDLAWWASLTLTQARRGIELADLDELHVAGHDLYAPPGLEPVEVPRVLLLANFDELISHARDAELRAEVGPDFEDIMSSTGLLVIDGRLAGHWHRHTGTEHVDVTVASSAPLDRAARAELEVEAAGFGAFLGLEARVTMTG